MWTGDMKRQNFRRTRGTFWRTSRQRRARRSLPSLTAQISSSFPPKATTPLSSLTRATS